MLVLTRKPAESIIINGAIRVTVLGIKGNQIRVGIAAPDGVPVDREEVFLRREEFAHRDAERGFAEAWLA